MFGTNMEAGMIVCRITKTRTSAGEKGKTLHMPTEAITTAHGIGLRRRETLCTILPLVAAKRLAL